MNPEGLAEGKPHMIDNYISIVFVIVVNHVGFIIIVYYCFNCM